MVPLFFYHKCIKLLPENVLTVLAELENIELLVDRKSKIGCNVRYNVVCMEIIFIILFFYVQTV